MKSSFCCLSNSATASDVNYHRHQPVIICSVYLIYLFRFLNRISDHCSPISVLNSFRGVFPIHCASYYISPDVYLHVFKWYVFMFSSVQFLLHFLSCILLVFCFISECVLICLFFICSFCFVLYREARCCNDNQQLCCHHIL